MNVAPLEPAAPVLEAVDQTSARVHFTLPPVRPGAPPHTCVVVSIGMLRDGSSEWKPVDSKTSTLSEGRAHAVSSTSALVKGLVAGATYRANIIVKNAHGPGPSSNTSEGATLPDEELHVAGERTWAERDAELRKRAIDLESASTTSRTSSRVPPRAKRAKR